MWSLEINTIFFELAKSLGEPSRRVKFRRMRLIHCYIIKIVILYRVVFRFGTKTYPVSYEHTLKLYSYAYDQLIKHLISLFFYAVELQHDPLRPCFTWSGGPRSCGVSFFCLVSSRAWKQKKPTPLDRGPPLHVNRPLMFIFSAQHTQQNQIFR